jgi:hypothetical protein
MEPINNPNRENLDPVYWDKVLKSHGLGMSKGDSPRIRVDTPDGKVKERLTCLVGGFNNIAGLDEQIYREETGRVSPSGKGPKDS